MKLEQLPCLCPLPPALWWVLSLDGSAEVRNHHASSDQPPIRWQKSCLQTGTTEGMSVGLSSNRSFFSSCWLSSVHPCAGLSIELHGWEINNLDLLLFNSIHCSVYTGVKGSDLWLLRWWVFSQRFTMCPDSLDLLLKSSSCGFIWLRPSQRALWELPVALPCSVHWLLLGVCCGTEQRNRGKHSWQSASAALLDSLYDPGHFAKNKNNWISSSLPFSFLPEDTVVKPTVCVHSF